MTKARWQNMFLTWDNWLHVFSRAAPAMLTRRPGPLHARGKSPYFVRVRQFYGVKHKHEHCEMPCVKSNSLSAA